MPAGIKHIIECHCILPQFKKSPTPPYHKFVVFSIIDDNDVVQVKHAACNNCGVIHKVTDIMKSEVSLGNENVSSVINIDDIKLSLNDNIIKTLESYKASLATWEEAAFIFEYEKWGSTLVLSAADDGDQTVGKIIRINKNSIKIEQFASNQFIT